MNYQYVYMLETLDCDWDETSMVKGLFSDLDKAIEYVKQNHYILRDNLNEVSYNGELDNIVFSAEGYTTHPSDVKEDDYGLYVLAITCEGYKEKYHLTITTSFTITRARLDSLLD